MASRLILPVDPGPQTWIFVWLAVGKAVPVILINIFFINLASLSLIKKWNTWCLSLEVVHLVLAAV